MGLMATRADRGAARVDPDTVVAGRMARSLSSSLRTFRSLQPFGWARESLILLCMQTLDGYFHMRLGRPWFWPFRKMLMSHGEQVPTFIPRANEFAREGWPRWPGGTP